MSALSFLFQSDFQATSELYARKLVEGFAQEPDIELNISRNKRNRPLFEEVNQFKAQSTLACATLIHGVRSVFRWIHDRHEVNDTPLEYITKAAAEVLKMKLASFQEHIDRALSELHVSFTRLDPSVKLPTSNIGDVACRLISYIRQDILALS